MGPIKILSRKFFAPGTIRISAYASCYFIFFNASQLKKFFFRVHIHFILSKNNCPVGLFICLTFLLTLKGMAVILSIFAFY